MTFEKHLVIATFASRNLVVNLNQENSSQICAFTSFLLHDLQLVTSPVICFTFAGIKSPEKMAELRVRSPNVRYTEQHIESTYKYQTTQVDFEDEKIIAIPKETSYNFR